MDHETLEIVRAFVAESIDSLDEQEGKIQTLTESGSKEIIHSIFRVFHTIKGLSGFLGFHSINTVAHETEAFLDVLRKKPEVIGEAVRNLIYESFDTLRTLLGSISSKMNDKGYEEDVRRVISNLQGAITLIRSGEVLVAIPRKRSVDVVSPSIVSPPSSIAYPNDAVSTHTSPLVMPNDVQNSSEHHVSSQTIEDENTQRSGEDSLHINIISKEQAAFFDSNQFRIKHPVGEQIADGDTSVEGQYLSVPYQAGKENDLRDDGVISSEDARKYTYQHHIFQHYIAEALQLIAVTEDGCVRLKQNPHDMTVVGAIFGAIQNFKGNPHFIWFASLQNMTIELENIVDAVRRNKLEIYPGLISMLVTNVASMKASLQQIPVTNQSNTPASVPLSFSAQSSASETQANVKTIPSLLIGDISNDVRIGGEKFNKLFTLVRELVAIEAAMEKKQKAENFNNPVNRLKSVTHEIQKIIESVRVVVQSDT